MMQFQPEKTQSDISNTTSLHAVQQGLSQSETKHTFRYRRSKIEDG